MSIALCDPRLHIAGLAHILLPYSHGVIEEPGRFADTGIIELLRQLNELPKVGKPHWTARIAGGAAMFPGHDEMTIGSQNIAAVERSLYENNIPVVAKACGGEQGRRVSIDVPTGSMTVQYTGNHCT
ncbi:chemotaxis protein CheD [Planctomycetaceae bacterium]|nr:chemotaxis protein CheD [Planctomycetaceae bacterium]